MKQHYFVVVLAHSLHGRLRRIHIPHHSLYIVLALALFGGVSLFGMVSSYLRMTWKISNYNTLRSEVDTLRNRYQALQRDDDQKKEQLASFQMLASEMTMALGLKRKIEGTDDIADEGPLMPTFKESIEEYNFLKSASLSRVSHNYARAWQKNTVPSLWPVNGRILSRFGDRQDPFSGEGAFHYGVDISATMGTPVHAAAGRHLSCTWPSTKAQGTARWSPSTTATGFGRGTRICPRSMSLRDRKSAAVK